MTHSEKLYFLQHDFINSLSKLSPETKGNWGVMNPQQMVEHMSESISIAYGKIKQPLTTAPELLHRYKEFAMSDKPFKENTKNALMGETPVPVKKKNITEAIEETKTELTSFVKYYENKNNPSIVNPFFGELSFEEWTHLLNKHAKHHLKQFGLLK